MTTEILKQGMDINDAIEQIDRLKNVCKAENLSVTAGETISFAKLDKQTRKELIKAMNDVLNERREMLEMELQEL